jgi:hypothetical protein
VEEINSWLLYTMAYAGVIPISDPEPAQEAVNAFQSTPVLEAVAIDKGEITRKLIQEIGIKPADTSSEYLN